MVNVVRNKKSNRILIGVVAFMFVALLSVMIVVITLNATRSSYVNNSDTDNTNTPTKDEGGDEEADKDGESGGEPDDDTITGQIDYRSLARDTLQIRTTINESLSDGTCSLTLTGPNGQEYKTTSRIMSNSSSTSTCNGFDIDMNQVEKDDELRAGKWTITIDLSSGGKTGQVISDITM